MIVDSGCSGHMSGTLRPSDCDNIREVSEKIRTADGTFVPAAALGDYGAVGNVLLVPDVAPDKVAIIEETVQLSVAVASQPVPIFV